MAFSQALRFLESGLRHVLATEDAQEGIRSVAERRPGNFKAK